MMLREELREIFREKNINLIELSCQPGSLAWTVEDEWSGQAGIICHLAVAQSD